LALAGTGAGACSRTEAAPPPLRLLDWSGRDGASVPLDQPLVLTFSEELATPLRPSWLHLLGEDGRPCYGIRLEARGRLLLVHPRLPLRADLSDAGLPPGQNLRLRLAGLPRLQALASVTGGRLLGDLEIRLRAMSPEDPAAMSGSPSSASVIRLLNLSESGVLSLGSARQGPARLRFSSALDPRSLQEPARLQIEASTEVQPSSEDLRVGLNLSVNTEDGATLDLDLGNWTGRGLLTLPEGLEGLGGHRLSESSRRIRVWRGP
jgi:hypothetical protein